MLQIKLHNLLYTYFNKNELQTLCFDLNINFENLPGETLDDKARELINFCYRYGQMASLINRCHELRPIISWPNAQELKDSLDKSFQKTFDNIQDSNNPTSLNQTIQGEYNAVSGHGGKSTINVTNIHQSPIENVTVILNRGIELTQAQVYDQAIDVLNTALQLAPTSPKSHFYMALAMLKGNRPKLLNLSTIRTIEKHLRVATELAPQFGQAYTLWALLKYDYYVMNSIRERPPTVSQLLKRNWSISQEEISELKAHIEAPQNEVWEWLQSL